MTTRRSFLKGLTALAAAPAIVKAENIMRINPTIWVPPCSMEIGHFNNIRFIECGEEIVYVPEQMFGEIPETFTRTHSYQHYDEYRLGFPFLETRERILF